MICAHLCVSYTVNVNASVVCHMCHSYQSMSINYLISHRNGLEFLKVGVFSTL